MVGQLVRRTRCALGWSQQEAARRTGLRQNYLSDLEGGKIGMPRARILALISAGFGIPLADLYRAGGRLEGLSDAELDELAALRESPEFMRLWRDLDPAERADFVPIALTYLDVVRRRRPG